MPCLLVSVRFFEGRYHASGEWPPSPARLFQAFVAGAARGSCLSASEAESLQWLEKLDPPLFAAPPASVGQAIRNFVPNNDLDAVGGDPARVGEIRAPKVIRPRHFDPEFAVTYCWTFEDAGSAGRHALNVCSIADGLYQLGRGVDMAWAQAEIIPEDEAQERLCRLGCDVRRPNVRGTGLALPCPRPGSLASLIKRFEATGRRFSVAGTGRKTVQLFSQPPKPEFAQVPYDSPLANLLFDITNTENGTAFAPQKLWSAAALTEKIREFSAERLKRALPQRSGEIDRVFVGRGGAEADKARRIRIIPLPSVGHLNVENSIRRVLVSVPPDCPIAAADIEWAFSGLALEWNAETGEIPANAATLVAADNRSMLEHYGIGSQRSSRVWRTVTPAALPDSTKRRRIDPARMRERSEQKDGSERIREERLTGAAACDALRHAGITQRALNIRVQREPWTAKGARAEQFAAGTRFAKERLWHVEIEFAKAMEGPIVIGDGRYLGLGLMAPKKAASRDVFVFLLRAKIGASESAALARAARRALMALARDGNGLVPLLFSGHEEDGAPARSGAHRHVFIAPIISADGKWIDRLVVAAPWICDRSYTASQRDRLLFDDVVSSLAELRAGRLGLIRLDAAQTRASDGVLLGPSLHWETRTAYRPVHHPQRRECPAEAVKGDLLRECLRRDLPKPEIEIQEITVGPNGGNVFAKARLCFAVAVSGPVLLGSGSHSGSGLFAAVVD